MTLQISGTAMAIAMNIYYNKKYAAREAKLGIKWQWKRDAKACALCEIKFPTTAVRKEESKHHCRMCGRVMCHACASTYLFYPVHGKNHRTCNFCIKNGGPPEECKLKGDTSGQRSMFAIVYEQQQAFSLKSKANAAKFKAKVNLRKGKNETNEAKKLIMQLEAEDAIIFEALARKPMAVGNLIDAGIKARVTAEEPNTFTVFLPPTCKAGAPLEVINEYGERCVTVVPSDEDVVTDKIGKPILLSTGIIGKVNTGFTSTVVRKTTEITIGRGLDGIVFVVNKDLPKPSEQAAAGGAGDAADFLAAAFDVAEVFPEAEAEDFAGENPSTVSRDE